MYRESVVKSGYLVKWQNDKSTATTRLDDNGDELRVDGTEATVMRTARKAKSFIAVLLLSGTAVHVTELATALHEHLHTTSSSTMHRAHHARHSTKFGDSDRSFSAAGPRLWNDLPPRLRWPGLSFDSFRRPLKTHLFGDCSAFRLIGTI